MVIKVVETPTPKEIHVEQKPGAKPKKEALTSGIVDVTPELAQTLLTNNVVNRNLRPIRVEQYVRDMLAGNWTLNNDAICISADGVLLNGQHRLTAVIKSGVTVRMLVMSGLDANDMVHMDRGIARTAADGLRMMGEASTAALASALRWVWLVDRDAISQYHTVALGDSELFRTLDAHPEIRDSVKAAMRIHHAIDATITPLAITHWLISKQNGQDVADFFFEQLATRANEPKGSAIHAIHNRVTEARKHRMKPTIPEYIYLLIKGFNYWSNNQMVAKLSMTTRSGIITSLPEVAVWEKPEDELIET